MTWSDDLRGHLEVINARLTTLVNMPISERESSRTRTHLADKSQSTPCKRKNDHRVGGRAKVVSR